MEVIIGKKSKDPITYRVDFHHNIRDKISGVTIFKNDRFIVNGSSICDEDSSYCRDCCRKHALADAFERAGINTIPREHRFEFWEAYRKLPRTATGKVKPRWPKCNLKVKKEETAAVLA